MTQTGDKNVYIILFVSLFQVISVQSDDQAHPKPSQLICFNLGAALASQFRVSGSTLLVSVLDLKKKSHINEKSLCPLAYPSVSGTR